MSPASDVVPTERVMGSSLAMSQWMMNIYSIQEYEGKEVAVFVHFLLYFSLSQL